MTPARAARLSAGRMLLEERDTASALDDDVDTVTKMTAADVGDLDEDDSRESDAKKAALLALLFAGGLKLAGKMQRTLQDRRQAVRAVAVVRLSAELSAALATAITLTPAGHLRLAEDAYRAQFAADSLAAAWKSAAAADGLRALDEEASVRRAVMGAGARIKGRLGLTATNETAGVWNDEHAAALRDAVAKDAEIARAVADAQVVREWSSLADVRTCSRCAAMNGKQVGLMDSFDGGDPPMHGRCRCMVTVVPSTSTRTSREAA